ncbi:hypothetical protein QN277_008877 [Acacia crassicarpa]|uniref:Uncharacterized protein n=1 Tax=Acacia crassicarpa TaxID=499986 RepID=A0AAE1M745_9FABA|nr:hypothetical protein QN277_008877 [Acacia crassicarpa]
MYFDQPFLHFRKSVSWLCRRFLHTIRDSAQQKPWRENPSSAPRALLLLFFALLSLRFRDSQVHGLRSDLFQFFAKFEPEEMRVSNLDLFFGFSFGMWKTNQLILHFC